jgi:branched-chain amino acid transport system ATP-binding protein
MTPFLQAVDLHKSYSGVEAVRGASFTLSGGEIVALIGPNGAGKSTCFNMLNGQVRPDRGRVHILGRDVTGLGPRRVWALGVGRTFQVAATFDSMRVRENVQVALGMVALGVAGSAARWWPAHQGRVARREAEQALALVGLSDQADRPCGELAYGDLKRLELAIALCTAPRVLLMDEPTAGMAPGERTELMRLTARTARSRGMGVLFTEHDMDVVFAHADRILVLDRGLIIADGPPDMVRADAHVRSVYLGSGSTAVPKPA